MADIPLGRNATIKKNDVTIAAMKSFSLNQSVDKIDVSAFGTLTSKFEPGIMNWSGTMTGFIDKDSTQQEDLRDAFVAGTHLTDIQFFIDATSCFELDLGTDANGYILIDSYTINTDNNSVINFTMNFQGCGPLKRTNFDLD